MKRIFSLTFGFSLFAVFLITPYVVATESVPDTGTSPTRRITQLPRLPTRTPTPTLRLVEPLTIAVVRPNGGETLVEGKTYRISWKARSGVDVVFLYLAYGSGFNEDVNIVASYPNKGYYDWKVTKPIQAGDSFKILINGVDYGVGTWQDYSDNPFTIFSPEVPLTPATQ